MNRNVLPWACPAVLFGNDGTTLRLPVGTVLSAAEAEVLFGHHYDRSATYIVSSGGLARRIVDQDAAKLNGLNWTFSGQACSRSHVAPRKMRPDPRGSECCLCMVASKKRSRLRARKRAA